MERSRSVFRNLSIPQVPIPFKIEELTGIRDDMVMGRKPLKRSCRCFMEFCEGCVMIAHNAEFDMSFIRKIVWI